MKKIRSLIGTATFYKVVLGIAIPIMIQNGITNLAGLLDNVMVGQLGTEVMSGVAIVNQLMNIFYVSIFGMVSGASIFGAQYVGKGDNKGLQDTFRFRLYASLILAVVFLLIFIFEGEQLIGLFLTDNGSGDIALASNEGMAYLVIMFAGMVPYAISQAYASTLRDLGKTLLPMVSGFISVGVNLVLNYVLIFGHFGFPRMGVEGAAVGTIVSRLVEMLIIVVWVHVRGKEYRFPVEVFRDLKVPAALTVSIIKKGMPLFVNELLWSTAMAVLAQCYSVRGLDAVAAYNISNTVVNLFLVVMISLGNAIGIIVGQKLGAGLNEEAVQIDYQLIAFSEVCCTAVGVVLFIIAPVFVGFYNTTPEVKHMALILLRMGAAFIPVHACYNSTYFTLRCGGKTLLTFLFDAVSLWAVSVVLAFILAQFTTIPMIYMYLIISCVDIPKVLIGLVLVKKKIWVNNMVV